MASAAVSALSMDRTTDGHVTPRVPSTPTRLLMPTETPASFMPICPRHPVVVNTRAAGASSGWTRKSSTCSVALSCISQVWPSIPWPDARASGTIIAVQSSSMTSVGIGPPTTARTVSTKSVNPPTTIASAGEIPAAFASAFISSNSAGSKSSCAASIDSAMSSTSPRVRGPPLHRPEDTRSTRSLV